MDFKQIKELIKLVNESQIGEVLIENDDLSLRIRHIEYNKKNNVVAAPAMMPAVSSPAPQATGTTTPATPSPEKEEKAPTKESSDDVVSDENLVTVKSPMIGTFYRSSSPDKPPYVKVGDQINKEDVLCIIEAMKLFNEIESEYSLSLIHI